MTAVPREVATKRPAQIAPARRPVRGRKAQRRADRWVLAILLFGLPLLFITAAGLGFIYR